MAVFIVPPDATFRHDAQMAPYLTPKLISPGGRSFISEESRRSGRAATYETSNESPLGFDLLINFGERRDPFLQDVHAVVHQLLLREVAAEEAA